MTQTLKQFLRGRPDSAELNELLKEMSTDSPRAAAVLGASLIEDVLVGAIRYRLRKLTDREDADLFENTGPLATFAARIQIGYALNIYGANTRHDLETVRKIRNAFAHARRKMTFDTPGIEALCKGMHSRNDISERGDRPAKWVFGRCCHLLMAHLVTKIGPFPHGEMKIHGSSLD